MCQVAVAFSVPIDLAKPGAWDASQSCPEVLASNAQTKIDGAPPGHLSLTQNILVVQMETDVAALETFGHALVKQELSLLNK